jgi:predicted transcriptional regulator
MNKKQARKELGVNQTDLAKLLHVNYDYLRNIKTLTPQHISIIQGELAKNKVRELLTEVDRLERRCEVMQLQLNNVSRALDDV